MRKKYYYQNKKAKDFQLLYNKIDRKMLANYTDILKKRPMKTELPPAISECGMAAYEFLLDFGSFRDLQRHRAIVQRMPLLTCDHGFNRWYLDSLPPDLRKKTVKFIGAQEKKIKSLKISDEEKQYYIAMGYRVPCRFAGDLKALVYMAELRSTRFVHPTLVEQILKMIGSMKKLFKKDGLVFHLDKEPNRFDIKRGLQDIEEK